MEDEEFWNYVEDLTSKEIKDKMIREKVSVILFQFIYSMHITIHDLWRNL